MTTTLTTKEMKLKIDRERKADYRRRKKQANDTGTVLIRKRDDNRSIPTTEKLQKKKIDYTSIINRMTLREDDKIDTIKLYIDRIDRLFRGLFRVFFNSNNINLLDKENEIMLYLDDMYNNFVMKDGKPVKTDKDRNTIETFRSYINAIIVILDRFGEENIKNKYTNKSTELNKHYNKISKTNVLSQYEKNNWISWNEINTLTDRVYNTNVLNENEKFITILYTKLIAPRRIKDYQLMKIIKYNTRNSIPKYVLKKAEEDLTNNYMIVSSNNLVRRITFNNYKTKSSYGQIIVGTEQNNPDKNYFFLEPSVVKDLQKLLTTSDKKDGDYLLTNTRNKEPFTQPELTTLVQQTFKKITNKDLTCNMLRKIFITENVINNPKLSVNIKENIGKFMGHSLNTQATYNRVVSGVSENDLHIIRRGQFGLGTVSGENK